MTALKKIIKSRNMTELLGNISYDSLNKIAFALIAFFVIYPFFSVIIDLTNAYLLAAVRGVYNYFVMRTGIVVLIIYSAKKIKEQEHFSIFKFFDQNRAFGFFSVFIVLMIVSTAVNGFTELSLYGSAYRKEGLFGYISYFVYFARAYIISDKKLIKQIFYISCIGSVAVSTIHIIDHAFFGHNSPRGIDTIAFENTNHLGYYLMVSFIISVMLAVTEKKVIFKIVFSVCGGVNVMALLLNDTLGCELSAVIGSIFIVIVYSLHNGRFKLISILPAVIFTFTCVFGLFTSDYINESMKLNNNQLINDTMALTDSIEEAELSTGIQRMILWENTFRYVCEKPFLGFSSDGTGKRLENDTAEHADRCHCEYLNYAVSYGIPAAVFYISGVFTIYLRGLFRRKELNQYNMIGLCAAFAYLVSAAIGNTMYYTAPYLFIMLGFGYPKNKSDNVPTQEVFNQQINIK